MATANVCLDVDDEDEWALWRGWQGRWDGRVEISAPGGCGCCVVTHSVSGPVEAIDDLPEDILLWDPSDVSTPTAMRRIVQFGAFVVFAAGLIWVVVNYAHW